MSYGNHHGHGGAFGVLALVAAIAFAFGPRVARIVVGTVLIAGGLFLAYVLLLVMVDAI